MRHLSTQTHATDLVGYYGEDFTAGILAEHLHLADPDLVRTLASGTLVVNVDGAAVPIVCGDVIELRTEDGPVSGRCGLPVDPRHGGACTGHARQHDYWHSMSQLDTLIWEQRQDELASR